MYQIQECIKSKVNQIQKNIKFKIYFKFQSVVNSKGKISIVNVIQKCIKFKIVLNSKVNQIQKFIKFKGVLKSKVY